MAAPVLSSVSPASGPPGAAITCAGSGFDPGARIGCPALVPTTFVSAASLVGNISPDLVGAAGESYVVSVFVLNEDGLSSAALPFTVLFPAARLQTWTTVEAVIGEVPGFRPGGNIPLMAVEGWMRSVAQAISGTLLRRGLPLDAGLWPVAAVDTALPAAAGVLELINRMGAAARLASVVGGQFSGSGEWGLAKALASEYQRELKALQDGWYDKLFLAGAATFETGASVEGGDIETDSGDAEQAFTKGQEF